MSFSRDPYDVVLADLRFKRDEIDAAIRAIEAVRPPASVQAALFTPSEHLEPPTQVAGLLAGMSIEDASRNVLKQRGHPMKPQDLAASLKDGGLVMNSAEPANTISSVLHRGWRNGSDVVRVKRGTWGLAAWFPDRDMSFHAEKDDAPDTSDSSDTSDASDTVSIDTLAAEFG